MSWMEKRLGGGLLVLAGILALGALPARAERPREEPGGPAQQIARSYQKAEALSRQGKVRESAAEYERAVSLAERAYGEDSPTTVRMLLNLGYTYASLNDGKRAGPAFERAVRICAGGKGKDSLLHAQALTGLAVHFRKDRQAAQSRPLLKKALAIQEDLQGPEHRSVGDACWQLGITCYELKDYKEAAVSMERCRDIRRAGQGRDSYAVSQAENYLGLCRLKLGAPREALGLFEHVLAVVSKQPGKESADRGRVLTNLARAYEALEDVARAEEINLEALAVLEKALGRAHPEVLSSWEEMIDFCHRQGLYARAEAAYEKAIALAEEKYGGQSGQAGRLRNRLGLYYSTLQKRAEAEAEHRKALAIFEKEFGPEANMVATVLHNIANCREQAGDHEEAIRLLEKAIAIRKARLGPTHPDMAYLVSGLSGVYANKKDDRRAEALAREALAIAEAAPSRPLAVFHASLLGNIGLMCQRRKDYTAAERYFRRALEVSRGDSPLNRAASAHSLASLAAERGDTATAAEHFNTVLRAYRAYAAHVLPTFALPQQKKGLTQVFSAWDSALSIAVNHPTDADLQQRAAGWLLNRKGMALETCTGSMRNLLATASPEDRKALSELLAIRRELAALALTLPGPDSAATRREELMAREAEMTRNLLRKGVRATNRPPWVEVDEVRKCLPRGGVFIDIARMPVFQSGTGKWKPARYVAWLTPKEGPVTLVDLGEAGPIEAAVKVARQRLADGPERILAVGEPDAEAELNRSLTLLAKRILHPLLPAARQHERWALCPDGELWLVPWNALPLPDGRYAVEKHTISHVASGRDLAARSVVGVRPALPLILADPDFDLARAAVDQQARQWLGQAAESRSPGGRLALGVAGRLPGTRREAEAVAPWLKAYAGAEPKLLLGAKAVKAAVQAAHSPRVLLLSTHGFFLPADGEPSASSPRADNPLLRCGLLFAGCNDPEGSGAGVLTGLEITAADLRGTDLVVLSACETGLGDVRTGEGVAGLRQAFQLAGARSVVATLWQVPDKESALQMSRFFAELAHGKDRAEALRQAQLSLIEARRKRHEAAHPFFWAAFTLTGQ